MSTPAPESPVSVSRPVLRRVALWGPTMLACVAVAGFFVLPYFARPYGERLLTQALGRPVAIDEVRINPFRLSAEVRGLHVEEREGGGDALAVDALYANLEAVSLLEGGAVLSELRVDNPRLQLERFADGSYNWSDVLERLANEDSEAPPLFSVNNIRVVGGHVLFDDRPLGLHHELSELALGIPFLSNLPVKVDVFVEPSLSARLNGDPVMVSGRTKPFSVERETSLDLELEGVELAAYLDYLPFRPAFRLPSGRLTTHLSLAFTQPAEGKPTVALKGSVQVDDLEIQDTSGTPAIRVPEMAVELTDVQPLARKWHFARLRVQEPQIDLVRLADGGLNVARLLAPPKKARAGAKAASEKTVAPIDFLLESARVRDGRVRLADHSLPSLFRSELQAVAIDVRNLASTAGEPADVLVDFITDGGEKFSFQDRLRLVPFELEGTASIDNLQPARYGAYLAGVMPGGEVRNGRVDGVVRYRVTTGANGPDGEVVAETLALRDFVLGLKGREAPLVTVGAADARELALRPFGRSLRVAELGVRGAGVSVLRQADGRLDLQTLFGRPAKGGGKTPWAVAVNRFTLEGGSLRLEDRSAATPAVTTADELALTVNKLDTAGPAAAVDLRARIGQRARLTAAGTLAPAPLEADLRVELEQLELKPLQGYLVGGLKVAVTGGKLGTRGRLALEQGRDGALKGRFRGELDVADFAAVDKENTAELLRWRRLKASGTDLQFGPFGLALESVALTSFYSRLVLDEQGRLNLRDLGARRADADQASGGGEGVASAELPPVSAGLPPLRIGKVSFKDGRIAFSDRFIRPNYDATLTGVEGSLNGLSSDPASLAQLDLKGRVDDAAAVTVSGRLNPFRDDRFLDLAASVRDFDLPALSGYAGKYVGYGIERGKLSAEFNYKVEQRRLTATNRVFLDQLTFGKRVDSPDAIKLPVQLGVALLKNPRGEIDLDLPVSGSLDDPQFSVVGLLFRAFGNLLVKAAASPFTMLGSILGGGAELSYVEFVPGVAVIDGAMRQKLAALAKALEERPGLRLDIAGRADAGEDGEGLRQAVLEDALRALKRQELAGKGEVVPVAEALVVSTQDYPALLKRLYQEAKFDKPRNFFGVVRDLPAAEMEALMLANTKVGEADLHQLAQRRAQSVRDWLVREGGIDAERLFVVAPKVLAAGATAGGRRTEFTLR